ncbi:MAG: MFS transporter [Nitrospirae bacterium]|nr:MAG: MFS transporter [Nitrospirota bacterium]
MPENHVMNHTSWRHGLTRYQWLVLLVAWLGWVFDSMDATIYAIVLHPALAELLRTSVAGGPVTHEVIGWYGGLIFSIFLIGWAVGGVLFGIVADYFGRTKTLIITILVYSLFTGLAALSDNWWHLAIYRFVTALGIGGEWAAGAVIVAEVWPEEKRAKAAGILQSAWAAGFFLAASINLLLQSYSWRVLFLVGILPAFMSLFIFIWVQEPDRWVKSRSQELLSGRARRVKLLDLFRPRWSDHCWPSWRSSDSGARPTGYRHWCGNCRTYRGWTGPYCPPT